MDLQEYGKMLTEAGIELVEKKNLDIKWKDGIIYGVFLDLQADFKVNMLNDYIMLKRCKRGTEFAITFKNEVDGIVTMEIGTIIPNRYADYVLAGDIVATTFPDLCWLYGEGTTHDTIKEVGTELRKGVEVGDLTWILPSKFLDDLIECIYSLNSQAFEGILGDSIIYGPLIRH